MKIKSLEDRQLNVFEYYSAFSRVRGWNFSDRILRRFARDRQMPILDRMWRPELNRSRSDLPAGSKRPPYDRAGTHRVANQWTGAKISSDCLPEKRGSNFL